MERHRISNISEPERLYLAWQAPDNLGDRFRWAVGVLHRVDGECVLRYLENGPKFEQLNSGRRKEGLESLDFQGYPGFDPRICEHRKGVLDALMRRLPPRDRADFREYLQFFCLPDDFRHSDFALLGYTGAKLPSDGFSIVDPLDPQTETCEVMLEVAGFRYHQTGLTLGEEVSLKPEPDNPQDPDAVGVFRGSERIGYVNRLKAPTIRTWLATRYVTGVIERLNGNPNRPRAFVFVWVRPLAAHAAA